MKTSLKKSIVLAVLSVPVLASANLLTNGSFESNLAGWTPASASNPVTIVTYNALPGAYGELIPTDNAASQSPDAAGTKGAYFVNDLGAATLTQSFVASSTWCS